MKAARAAADIERGRRVVDLGRILRALRIVRLSVEQTGRVMDSQVNGFYPNRAATHICIVQPSTPIAA